MSALTDHGRPCGAESDPAYGVNGRVFACELVTNHDGLHGNLAEGVFWWGDAEPVTVEEPIPFMPARPYTPYNVLARVRRSGGRS